jgi:hypothetical protein
MWWRDNAGAKPYFSSLSPGYVIHILLLLPLVIEHRIFWRTRVRARRKRRRKRKMMIRILRHRED